MLVLPFCYRYVGAHYLTYLWAFSGIYQKNYNPDVPYNVYALVLLGLVAALALAKIIIVIVRSIKHPIIYNSTGKISDSKL